MIEVSLSLIGQKVKIISPKIQLHQDMIRTISMFPDKLQSRLVLSDSIFSHCLCYTYHLQTNSDKTLFNPPKSIAEQIRQAVFPFLTESNLLTKVFSYEKAKVKKPKLTCLGLIEPQSESATISLLEAFYNKARLNDRPYAGACNPFCFPW